MGSAAEGDHDRNVHVELYQGRRRAEQRKHAGRNGCIRADSAHGHCSSANAGFDSVDNPLNVDVDSVDNSLNVDVDSAASDRWATGGRERISLGGHITFA
jgi:hypothetical protein